MAASKGNIHNHLILSRACDGEEMKKHISMDSYHYFKSGSVGKILQLDGNMLKFDNTLYK